MKGQQAICYYMDEDGTVGFFIEDEYEGTILKIEKKVKD